MAITSADIELSHLLGNIFYFYTQFACNVSRSIQESLKPLENELKVCI